MISATDRSRRLNGSCCYIQGGGGKSQAVGNHCWSRDGRGVCAVLSTGSYYVARLLWHCVAWRVRATQKIMVCLSVRRATAESMQLPVGEHAAAAAAAGSKGSVEVGPQ